MQTTERKYWWSGWRYDPVYGGRHFWQLGFRVGSFGVIICQPFRANAPIQIYKLV